MQNNDQPLVTNDPFNAAYFFGAVAVFLAVPMLHIILGWLTFFFK